MEPRLTATSVIRSPVNTANFFGLLVTVLTGFHCTRRGQIKRLNYTGSYKNVKVQSMFFALLQWWQPRCIVKNIFLKFCKCQPRYSYKIYSHWKVCTQLLQLRKEGQKNLGLPCRKPEFLSVSTIAIDYLYNKMSTFLRCLQYQNMLTGLEQILPRNFKRG